MKHPHLSPLSSNRIPYKKDFLNREKKNVSQFKKSFLQHTAHLKLTKPKKTPHFKTQTPNQFPRVRRREEEQYTVISRTYSACTNKENPSSRASAARGPGTALLVNPAKSPDVGAGCCSCPPPAPVIQLTIELRKFNPPEDQGERAHPTSALSRPNSVRALLSFFFPFFILPRRALSTSSCLPAARFSCTTASRRARFRFRACTINPSLSRARFSNFPAV